MAFITVIKLEIKWRSGGVNLKCIDVLTCRVQNFSFSYRIQVCTFTHKELIPVTVSHFEVDPRLGLFSMFCIDSGKHSTSTKERRNDNRYGFDDIFDRKFSADIPEETWISGKRQLPPAT